MAPMTAMHMANELLDVPTAAATLALGAGAVFLAALRLRSRLPADRLPLMGVMGAFVFAGQMVNFTLPGMPGTSGHLGGGVLLAILLGPASAVLTMTAILIIQCLIFQDGGMLALGCNILNLGVVPCLLGGWLYGRLLGPADSAPAWRQYASAWLACLIGVTAGAAMVPLQAWAAGRLAIRVTDFLVVMIGVHLIIGAIEGAITFTVVAYIRQVRPSALGLATSDRRRDRVGKTAVLASLLVTAGLLAGVVSWFASTHPDGLEWSYQEHKYDQGVRAIKPPDKTMVAVDDAQGRLAPLPDYTARDAPGGDATHKADGGKPTDEPGGRIDGWGSLAGLIGTAVTLLVVYLLALFLRRRPTRAPAPNPNASP